MKKYFIAIAIAAIALTGCNKTNPTDDMIKAMDEATEQMKKASSFQDVQKIGQEMGAKLTKIKGEHPDYKPSKEDQERIQEAALRMAQASAEVSRRTMPDPRKSNGIAPVTGNNHETAADETPADENPTDENPAT